MEINKTYVVGNHGSKFYGRYVVPMLLQQDGCYLCRFTGKDLADIPMSFETEDLITIAEYKKNEMEESDSKPYKPIRKKGF